VATSNDKQHARRALDGQLGEAALALRSHCGPGNLTLHLPEAGELVAVLPVNDEEAKDLMTLLGGSASS
jgi:hypothetical protein